LIPTFTELLTSYITAYNDEEDITDDIDSKYLKPSTFTILDILEKLFQEINSNGINYSTILEKFNLEIIEEKSPIEMIFDHFKSFYDKLDDGEILSKVLDIMLVLNSVDSKKELKSEISKFALKLLERDSLRLKGEKLSNIITIFIENSPSPCKTILKITEENLVAFVLE
jgi:protein involved in sex pheromone biosynthesis